MRLEDLDDLLGGSGKILLRPRWKAQLVSSVVEDDVFVGLQLLALDCGTAQGLPGQQNITRIPWTANYYKQKVETSGVCV